MRNDYKLLISFVTNHTTLVADLLEEYSEMEVASFLNSVSDDIAIVLIQAMDKFKAAKSFESLDKQKRINVLLKLSFPVCEILMRLIRVDLQTEILNSLPIELAKPLRKVLSFNQNLAGAHINPFALTLNENITVNQSIKKIKKENNVIDSHLNIVNNNQMLVGNIELKKLISAKGNVILNTIMDSNPPKILATVLTSKVMKNPGWDQGYTELPVVNSEGIYMGTISKKVINIIENKQEDQKTPLYHTGAALGELYQIGLSGILRGVIHPDIKANNE